jgi:hypothetical protein
MRKLKPVQPLAPRPRIRAGGGSAVGRLSRRRQDDRPRARSGGRRLAGRHDLLGGAAGELGHMVEFGGEGADPGGR